MKTARVALDALALLAIVDAFPTISLISATTISTGCWPAHHGIVTNVFIDPVHGV